MNIKNAVRQRILNLCEAHKITINRMALESELTQSTLNSIVNTGSNSPTLATISKICTGLNITIREFFDDDLFDNIE